MRKQGFGRCVTLFEIAVGEVCVDSAVADRMHRLPITSATAFGDGVMPLGNFTHLSGAEPAILHNDRRRCFSMIPVPNFPRHQGQVSKQ